MNTPIEAHPDSLAAIIRADLTAVRQAAHEEAAAALEQAGFELGERDEWHGILRPPGNLPSVPVRVCLPDNFPDSLPEVFADRGNLARRIAHAEASDKICIAPLSGVLLDADRPRALVTEALARATDVIGRGLTGASDPDLQLEILAYWGGTGSQRTYSICDPDGTTRQLSVIRLRALAMFHEGATLLADSVDAGVSWASNLGTSGTFAGTAFFVSLQTSFSPPEFGQAVTVNTIRDVISRCAARRDAEAFRHWLHVAELPVLVVLSLPEVVLGTGRRLLGVRIDQAQGSALKLAGAGFRPGRIPTQRLLVAAGLSPVIRLNLARLDAGFLGARGGAAGELATKTAVLVGAGAVGSELALHLAALGVGRLRIVDPEQIKPENIHRHALGMRHLWQSKAVAICAELASRFPHLAFESRNMKVEDLLQNETSFIIGADVVLIALGDETLERRINRLLHGIVPRVHTWVEPLGIGGHAMACSLREAGAGCYECLFETHPVVGLCNRAALSAPGQEVRRSLAGCAGTFSPFSALDARRSAIEAAELAGRILSGAESQNMLVTWRGEGTLFEREGLRVSRRAAFLAPGARVRLAGATFARTHCQVCGDATRPEREDGI